MKIAVSLSFLVVFWSLELVKNYLEKLYPVSFDHFKLSRDVAVILNDVQTIMSLSILTFFLAKAISYLSAKPKIDPK